MTPRLKDIINCIRESDGRQEVIDHIASLERVIEVAEKALDIGGFHATARGNINDALIINQALAEIGRMKEKVDGK